MSGEVQQFTSRQYMIRNDFEFYHYKDEPHLEVEFHSHDFYEVYFYVSGNVTYVIEGKVYSLKPGDIILINNKEIHRTVIDPGAIYERYLIWINPDYIARYCTAHTDLAKCFESTAKRKYNLLRPGAEMLAYLKSIVYKLEKVSNSTAFGSEILKDDYLTELLVFLNRAYMDANDEEIEGDVQYNEKINDIIRHINLHLSEELTLEDISARFYISKYHLLREFKKNTGYTIHQYIQKKRLILARMLLKGNIKVTEVVIKCGFGDYSNFIRSFKREYGVSPKKYCRHILN